MLQQATPFQGLIRFDIRTLSAAVVFQEKDCAKSQIKLLAYISIKLRTDTGRKMCSTGNISNIESILTCTLPETNL